MTQNNRPRVLLTSTFRPWGVDDLYNTTEMNFDGLAANFIRLQEPFVPHGLNSLPATHFIAANLDIPTVVLDHPSIEEFEREVAGAGYEYIGISFMTCEFLKARKMVEVAKRAAPGTKVVLGGYGVATPGVEAFGADEICRGEGVEFFRKVLGLDPGAPLRNPAIQAMPKSRYFDLVPIHMLTGFYWYTTGLGCRMGCEFCVTSNYWGKKYIPLIRDGKQIFEEMTSTAEAGAGRALFAVNQDDFLMEKKRNMELWETARSSDRKPYGFMCFTSAKAASMFTPRQLIEMGLDVLFLGVETTRAKSEYGEVFNPKKHLPAGGKDPVDFRAVFKNLKRHGIKTVAACITAVPGHTLKSQHADIRRALDLEATLYQFSSYTPFPGTPLWNRFREKGLFINDCARRDFDPRLWKNYDGISLVFRHPHLSSKQAKELPDFAWREEYRKLGPSMLRMLDCDLTAWEMFQARPETIRMKRILEDKVANLKGGKIMIASMLARDLGLSKEGKARAEELLGRIEKKFGRMGRFERALAGALADAAASYYSKVKKGETPVMQEMSRTAYPAAPSGILRTTIKSAARRAASSSASLYGGAARVVDSLPESLTRVALKGAFSGLRAAARLPGNPLGL